MTRGELAPGTPLVTGVRADTTASTSTTRRASAAGGHPPMAMANAIRRPGAR